MIGLNIKAEFYVLISSDAVQENMLIIVCFEKPQQDNFNSNNLTSLTSCF